MDVESDFERHSLPEGACCAVHPNVAAAIVCDRCGNFACGECAVIRGPRQVCRPCSRRFLGLGGSWLSVWAAILGFAGIGCAPAGPLAVILAIIDLTRIAARRSPRDGQTLNTIAIVLGLLGMALWAYLAWHWITEPAEAVYTDPYGF